MEKHKEKTKELTKNGYAVAYCAGHFDQEKRRYSYGVIIIDCNDREQEIYGSGMNQKYLDAQSVAGEIFGVLNAMDWAVSNGYIKLRIYTQTEQIGKWLSGEEKAESRAAKMLRIIYETKYADILQSEFQSVEIPVEHSQKAEELSKKSLTERKRNPVTGDSWFCVDAIGAEKIKSIIDVMKSDIKFLNIEEQDEPTKLSFDLTFATNQLAVTLFKSGKQTLLVRGRDSILFQVFVTYLNEHVEIAIEKVLSDAYRKRIDSLVLDQQVAMFIPVIPPTLSKAIVRLVRQAVINLSYSKGEEYLQYGIPVIKAMEVLLKTSFSEEDIAAAFDEVNQMGQVASRKHFGESIGEFATLKGGTNKEEADAFIRSALYDLNAFIVKLNRIAS